MIVRWSDPLAQLIVPGLDGNEDLPIFYAVLPDQPETSGRGCVSYYVRDENGHVVVDEKKGVPVFKTVDGMTSWRVMPECAEMLPVILEFYSHQHG